MTAPPLSTSTAPPGVQQQHPQPQPQGCRACSAARRWNSWSGAVRPFTPASSAFASCASSASACAAADACTSTSFAASCAVSTPPTWRPAASSTKPARRVPQCCDPPTADSSPPTPPRDASPFTSSSSSRSSPPWSRAAILVVLCAVLLQHATPAWAKICEVPRFIKLPPPIVYRTTYPSSAPKFVCSAFPPSSRVVFLQRRPSEDFPTTLSEAESRGTAVHRIDSSIYTTTDTDYYCRAHTDFGHLISRPFRIVPANIYPYSDKEPSQTVSFYKGNIAQVQCSIPRSQPAATVQFLKDGVVVGHSDKYLEARQPGVSWVALLIKEFSSADVGNYSCKARNPASLQEVESKATTKLTLQKASSAFEARFHKAFPFDHGTHQRVTVREGENVTLYCLPEGAPIPSVKWFRQSGASGGLPEGATVYTDFGAVRIDNVRPEHASTYTCSVQQGDRMINKAFELKVQERLKITVPPRDQVVEVLGSPTQLACEAEGGEGEIHIQWYYNAQPISAKHDANYEIEGSVLKVKRVTTDLLGIYQCVAKTTKEWTSSAAAVIMKGNELRRGESTRKHRTVVSAAGITASLTCPLTAAEQKKYDVKWYKGNVLLGATQGSTRFMPTTIPPTTFMNLLMARKSDSGLYNCRFFMKGTSRLMKQDFVRLIVSDSAASVPSPGRGSSWPDKTGGDGGSGRRRPGGKAKPVAGGNGGAGGRPAPDMGKGRGPTSREWSRNRKTGKQARLSRPDVLKIYDNLAASVTWNYTGPVDVESYTLLYRMRGSSVQYSLESDSPQWSPPQNLVTNYRKTFYLVTEKPLKPGHIYKFRVIAYLKSPIARGTQRLRSKWSKDVSFSHILSAKPRIVELKPLSPDAVRISWNYNSQMDLDRFVINYRERIDENEMDGYRSKVVYGGLKRSVTVSGLKSGTYYQFVVYGVLHPTDPEQRRITLFSNLESVQTLVPTNLPPGAEKAENNRLTFLIMGCLAGFLIVVVAVLMSACLWKQRKEKRRMRDESLSMIYTASALQAALNGTSIDSNYKDPKFLVPGTNSASSQLLLSNLGDGAVWQQQHQHQHSHQHHAQPPLPSHPRHNQSTNGGLRLNVNPEAASLMMNYDERFAALPPPPPPGACYFGNGTLRRESNPGRVGFTTKADSGVESLYATRNVEDPLYATRLHPAYAVTSPVGSIYPLPNLPAPLGGPPGRFSPYAVAVPPMHANGDGAESVYSYFSQQEAGTQHMEGPTPFSASRTVDRPRHHRRKRRRPTNNTTCSQSGLESGSETGAPHMKDMAVNTDMSSSDAIYESSIQASTTASPPPRMGALMMGGVGCMPGAICSTPSAYKSPPGGPEIPPPPPPPAHPVASVAALSTPLTSVASSSPSSSSGPPSSHTLTRRGTPNLFLDPPRVRDYTEYGVAVSPDTSSAAANGGASGASPAVPAV